MRKIQFASGHRPLPGWECYDRDMDITKPLPIPDASASHLFIEHGLEHVSPQEGMRFLIECHRVLAANGTFRICVPVLDRLPRDKALDIIFNHGHQAIYNHTLLTTMLHVAGFTTVHPTGREEIDQHWKQIGVELDTLETLRMEARK